MYDELAAVAPKVLPYMDSVWSLLDDKRREGKRILFEGAQGALLDIDHGTYPYVTSSNTVAGAGGDRLGPRPERDRLRARHLQGLHDARRRRAVPDRADDNEIGKTLGERGREFGTVTGRPRRCGWFDAVLVRQTVRTSGINGIALTKLDILDGFDEIKVCVGYRLDGREIDYLPASEHAQARVEPIYETIEGWQDADRAGARSWAQLPAQAIKYVRRIEELIGCPVRFAVDQPGAGGHNSDAKPVRDLSELRRKTIRSMADYHPLIARAVAGLEKNTGENRRALYERARTALVAQLRGVAAAARGIRDHARAAGARGGDPQGRGRSRAPGARAERGRPASSAPQPPGAARFRSTAPRAADHAAAR